MIPYAKSDGTITVYLQGVPYPVDASHPNFDAILTGLKEQNLDSDEMLKLVSVRSFIKSLNIGFVTVGVDTILYNGTPVHNHLTARMLEIISAGLDVTPWAKFMDNLYKNPSKTAVDELYLWLEKAGMPITEDGCFLAYKKVQDDYTSFHKNADGSACHHDLGTFVTMPRNQVDDRRHNTCSYGLHFCSFSYLPQYMGSQGRVLVVKINPAHVVSIPSDYDNAKGRTEELFVWSEVDQDKAQFAFSGSPVVNTSPVEVEDDFGEWQEAVASGDTTSSYDDWMMDQDDDLSLEAWQCAVSAGDTDLGYEDWASA